MELAIPILALGGLYFVSKQKKKEDQENFSVYYEDQLTNETIDEHNKHSKQSYSKIDEVDLNSTEVLTHTQKYQGDNYRDKYFQNSDNSMGKNGLLPPKTGKFPANDLEQTGMDVQGSFRSLTGEFQEADYFRHNNMVPYFGSKVRGRKFDPNNNEGLLDNYLGTGSQQIKKTEQSPLFAAETNLQWTHGMPNSTDFIKSRVNPSQKMSNVLPFQQETVGPGLGLGYTSDGSSGFNSGMMAREEWMPKTVDDLRVDSHRKPEGVGLFGYEGPANNIVKSQSTIDHMGRYEKQRPDTAFELGAERWFTTTGAEKNQPLRPTFVERDVNRPETSTEYIGVARGSNMAEYVDGEYEPSRRNEFGNVQFNPANAVGHGGATDGDYGIQSQMKYRNNRTSNIQPDSFGAVMRNSIGSVFAPLINVLRPSKKQNVIGTMRPYQNAATTVPLSYILDPKDRPSTTIRETTQNSKFHLNSNSNQYNTGAYLITDPELTPTERTYQSDFFYSGNASAGDGQREMRPYDAEYRQRNNDVKASTIDGRLVPGNMALNNDYINMTTKDTRDYLKNARAPVPRMSNQTTTGLDSMGSLQGKQTINNQYDYQRNQMDRSNIQGILKGNPYAISMMNGI